jgi:hypothetical protein
MNEKYDRLQPEIASPNRTPHPTSSRPDLLHPIPIVLKTRTSRLGLEAINAGAVIAGVHRARARNWRAAWARDSQTWSCALLVT